MVVAVRDDALLAPTREQALAAAQVLEDEGAAVVLLFGSVADGSVRGGSDIDLVAVFDDIDYDERYLRRWRLEAKCAAAAGVPVDVHVTDRPEWEHRTTKVSSSFEAGVARHHQVLAEREPVPGAVRWGKEIGMPDSNLAEAVQRTSAMRQALGRLAEMYRPWSNEIRVVDGQPAVDALVRDARLRSLCADASMTVENSLKAWAALNGVSSSRTHDIAELVGQARPLPGEFESALDPLRVNTMRPSKPQWDDITSWRIGGSYPDALPQATPERLERLARLLSQAAVVAAEATLDRLLDEGADPTDENVAACRQWLTHATAVLAAGDVVPDASAVPAAAAKIDTR